MGNLLNYILAIKLSVADNLLQLNSDKAEILIIGLEA